jgi:type IV secretory pathway VirB2 component (pilin)
MTFHSKARNAVLFTTAVLAFVLLPHLAHADIGGTGSGAVTQIVQWFMTNVARGLVMLGIIAIAIGLFVARFSMSVIASVVGGALILANADTIAGFFGF